MAENAQNTDMTLVIGADVDSSFKRIKQDILDIAKKFDENPINLKIRLDKTSEADVKGQLSSLTKQIESGTYKLHIDVDDSGVKEATEAVKSLKKEQQKRVVVGQTDTSAADAHIKKNDQIIESEKKVAAEIEKTQQKSQQKTSITADVAQSQKLVDIQSKIAAAKKEVASADQAVIDAENKLAACEKSVADNAVNTANIIASSKADTQKAMSQTSTTAEEVASVFKNWDGESVKVFDTAEMKAKTIRDELKYIKSIITETFENGGGEAWADLVYKDGSSALIDFSQGEVSFFDQLGNEVAERYNSYGQAVATNLEELSKTAFSQLLKNIKYARYEDGFQEVDTQIGDYSKISSDSDILSIARAQYIECYKEIVSELHGDMKSLSLLNKKPEGYDEERSSFMKWYEDLAGNNEKLANYYNTRESLSSAIKQNELEAYELHKQVNNDDANNEHTLEFYNEQLSKCEQIKAKMEEVFELSKQFEQFVPEEDREEFDYKTLNDNRRDYILGKANYKIGEYQSDINFEISRSQQDVQTAIEGRELAQQRLLALEKEEQSLLANTVAENEKLVLQEQPKTASADNTAQIKEETAALKEKATVTEQLNQQKDASIKDTFNNQDAKQSIDDAQRLTELYSELASAKERLSKAQAAYDPISEIADRAEKDYVDKLGNFDGDENAWNKYLEGLEAKREAEASALNNVIGLENEVSRLEDEIYRIESGRKSTTGGKSASNASNIQDAFAEHIDGAMKADEAVKNLGEDIQDVGDIDANPPGEIFEKVTQRATDTQEVIQEVVKTIDEANNKKYEVKNTFDEDGSLVDSVTKTTESFETETQAAKRLENELTSLAQAENKIASLKNTLDKHARSLSGVAGSEDAYKNIDNIRERIARFENEISSNEWSAIYKTELLEIDTSVKTLTSDVDKLTTSMSKQQSIEKAGTSKTKLLKQMSNYNKKLGSYQGGESTSEYSEINTLSSQLSAAYAKLKSTGNLTAYNAELEQIRSKFEQATSTADRFIKASQEVQRSVNAGNGALGAYNSGISNSSKVLNTWTAATKSSDAAIQESVQNIITARENLEALKMQYDHNGISGQEFAQKVRAANQVIKEEMQNLKDAGVATKSWGDRMGSLAQKFSMWLGASQIIMRVVQASKDLINVSIELDDAMTQLKIVTNETDATYQEFSENIAKSAQNLGTSVTDLIDATTTYSRLGYSLKDSSKLAEYTTMLQQVGDINTDDAQNAITAIIKAFDISTSGIEGVMDKLVVVGNNAPISVSQLAEGLNNSASSLKAAGNSFDESVALLTAANTVVQDASKASTGLRTITARLRNTKTELDSLGESMTTAEYGDLIESLTHLKLADGSEYSVKLTDTNGELRNTYDIIMDISTVWDQMSSNSQAALAETIAGSRMQNIFYSLVSGASEASNAMNLMANSAGAMNDAYDEYLQSTTAHINSFKAAFASLGSNLVDSSVLKFFVDIGTAILNVIDKITQLTNNFGGLATKILLAGGAFATFNPDVVIKGFTTITEKLTGFKSILSSLIAPISTLLSPFKKAASLSYTFNTGMTAAAQSTNVLTQSVAYLKIAMLALKDGITAAWASMTKFQKIASVVTLAIAGIAITTKLVDAAIVTFDEKVESANALREKIDDTKAGIEEIKSSAETLAGEYQIEITDDDTVDTILNKLAALESTGNTTRLSQLKAETAALEAQLAVQKDLLKVQKEEASQSSFEILNQKVTGTEKDANGVSYGSAANIIEDTKNKRSQLTSIEEDLTKQYEKQSELIDQGKKDTQEYTLLSKKIKKNESDRSRLTKDIAKNMSIINDNYSSLLDENGDPLNEDFADTIKSIQELNEDINNATNSQNAFSASAQTVASSVKSEGDKVSALSDKFKTITDILNAQTTGSIVSLEDYNNLAEYSEALEYHNGVMQYNVEKCNEITKSLAEEELAQIAVNKAEAQTTYLANAKKIQTLRQKEQTAAVKKQIQALTEENQTLKSNINEYNLMSDAIEQANSAYQHFINAQSAESKGKMFEGALAAFKTINDTLNNAESELFGRVGEEGFSAALDFVIPDSVDKDDEAAINAYISDVSKYLIFDDDGNFDGLDITAFCESAVEKGLMTFDAATDEFKVAGSKTMEDFAEGMNLSLPLVQAMFGELESFGGKFSWSDEATKTIGDLAVEATDAYESLRKLKDFEDLNLTLDVSDFENKELAIAELDKNIEAMNKKKATLNLDDSQLQEANSIIQYCVMQKQLLSQPEVMQIDTSKASQDYREILGLVQEFQNAINTKEMQAAIGADTSEVDAQIDDVVARINNADPKLKADIGIKENVTADSLKAQIGQITIDGLLNISAIDKTAVAGYESEPETKEGKVIWSNNKAQVDAFKAQNHDIDAYVIWKNDTVNLTTEWEGHGTISWSAAGFPSVNGTAHAAGTAAVSGDWGTAPGGTTLVGEL